MWEDVKFTYKGHTCKIEHDFEPDCVKAWHIVVKPNGEKVYADITPYDSGREVVKLWIDAGYPDRQGCGPLHIEDLQKMVKEVQ
tara:strand:+ start:67 stop:318 length:252 start_codon:yes stop_codon:yes gene_type:complete